MHNQVPPLRCLLLAPETKTTLSPTIAVSLHELNQYLMKRERNPTDKAMLDVRKQLRGRTKALFSPEMAVLINDMSPDDPGLERIKRPLWPFIFIASQKLPSGSQSPVQLCVREELSWRGGESGGQPLTPITGRFCWPLTEYPRGVSQTCHACA